MGMKKLRLPISVGVVDTEKSRPEVKDERGVILQPAITVVKHVDAGELVEIDEAEAAAIVKRHGPFRKTIIVEDEVAAAAPMGGRRP